MTHTWQGKHTDVCMCESYNDEWDDRFADYLYFPQDDGCVGQAVMEERLMMQQQQMEDDQRWLEQEESFMVMVMIFIY